MTNPEVLFDAIRRDDITKVRELIGEIGPDHLDHRGRSAVFHATELLRGDVLELLLQSGADVDLQDPEKKPIDRTAFLLAGSKGLDDMLRILVRFDPDVSIVNHYGGNALIPAAHHGHVSTVKWLLEHTAVEVNLVNNLGWTALLEAVILSDGGRAHQKIVEILLEHGADPSISDRDGMTPMDHALSKGYGEIVKILEGHGT